MTLPLLFLQAFLLQFPPHGFFSFFLALDFDGQQALQPGLVGGVVRLQEVGHMDPGQGGRQPGLEAGVLQHDQPHFFLILYRTVIPDPHGQGILGLLGQAPGGGDVADQDQIVVFRPVELRLDPLFCPLDGTELFQQHTAKFAGVVLKFLHLIQELLSAVFGHGNEFLHLSIEQLDRLRY